jgi:hypothetical protein
MLILYKLKLASQAPIQSMACNKETNTIAVGTELQDHMASIHLWYAALIFQITPPIFGIKKKLT